MGTLSTNNTSTTHAKIGDKVELAFTTNEAIDLTTSTAIIHGKAATMTSTGANAYKATITLDGTETQGAATYALTVKDVAGNAAATVSTGATGSVTVDLVAPKALSVVLNDVNGNGVGDAGETLVIAFDKAMDSAKADGLVEDFKDNEGLADNVFGIHSGTHQLGSMYVTDATLAWNPAKTELTITLGAGATDLVSGTVLVLEPSKFTDVAGNPAESNGQKVTLNKIK